MTLQAVHCKHRTYDKRQKRNLSFLPLIFVLNSTPTSPFFFDILTEGVKNVRIPITEIGGMNEQSLEPKSRLLKIT